MADPRPILVTGASGFVGAWLLRALEARGEGPVVGLADSSGPAPDAPLDAFEALDLRDPAATAAAVARWGPRTIFHLAGQASVAASVADPVETFEVNATGTLNLLEAVREHAGEARLLLVSSAEVYGQATPSPLSEEAALAPATPYAASKVALEALGLAYARTYGLAVVLARPFNHTGPGQTERFVLGSFARQIALIEAGRQPPVLTVGNLEVRRDFLDVRDVVQAYLALARAGAVGAAYNVCSGQAHRLADLLEALLAMARVGIEVRQEPGLIREGEPGTVCGAPDALQRATGWRAEVPLSRTLEDLLGSWRARMPYWGDVPTGLA